MEGKTTDEQDRCTRWEELMRDGTRREGSRETKRSERYRRRKTLVHYEQLMRRKEGRRAGHPLFRPLAPPGPSTTTLTRRDDRRSQPQTG